MLERRQPTAKANTNGGPRRSSAYMTIMKPSARTPYTVMRDTPQLGSWLNAREATSSSSESTKRGPGRLK